jgi:hypothetical protein
LDNPGSAVYCLYDSHDGSLHQTGIILIAINLR